MHAANLISIFPLVPLVIFSAATAGYLPLRSRGQTLFADMGLSASGRMFIAIPLSITAVLLAVPEYRVAGVMIASLAMMALAVAMLLRSRYNLAIPALLVLATLPLALPGPF